MLKNNLSTALEPVVDAFWALSYPILPLIDLSYKGGNQGPNNGFCQKF
jgi:hypothetical protein